MSSLRSKGTRLGKMDRTVSTKDEGENWYDRSIAGVTGCKEE